MELATLVSLTVNLAIAGFLATIVARFKPGNGPRTGEDDPPRTREVVPHEKLEEVRSRLETIELRFQRVVEEVKRNAEAADKKYRSARARERRAEQLLEDEDDGEPQSLPAGDVVASPGQGVLPMRPPVDDGEQLLANVRQAIAFGQRVR